MPVIHAADIFRCDGITAADLAIVFGSSSPVLLGHRIAAAAEMYRVGLVPRILLTGDGRLLHRSGKPEAVRMKEQAEREGVDAGDIVLETRSQTTFENARNCGQLLMTDRILQRCGSVLLVSSAWHMLRVLMLMNHHLMRPVRLFCSPCRLGYTIENWMDSEEGRRLVEKEIALVNRLLRRGINPP